MTRYEYKVVPAPRKAGKVKGVKGTDARFAHELAQLMNEYGADGWEYQRTDTLPCEERTGLMSGKTTQFQNLLVFRREIPGRVEPAPVPMRAAAPAPAAPSADAIASIHSAAPAPEPRRAQEPEIEPEPEIAPRRVAARPVPVETYEVEAEPMPEPEPRHEPAYEPEREEVATLPSFRSAKAAETPTFSSRSAEGRIPRLGAARRGDGTPSGPTLVKR